MKNNNDIFEENIQAIKDFFLSYRNITLYELDKSIYMIIKSAKNTEILDTDESDDVEDSLKLLFEKKIKLINNLYLKYPEITNKELQNAVNNIEVMSDANVNIKYEYNAEIINNEKIDIVIICVLIFCLAGMCLFNIDKIGMYIFGVVFFVAGHFVGLKVNKFGLIFLFSHSMTGAGLMIVSLLSSVFENPLMKDNPKTIYIYLGIVFFLIFSATILVILYNLSDKIKRIKHIIIVPLCIYTVAFFLAGLLPHIITSIYKLNIF